MNFSFAGFLECLISGIRYLPNTLLMTFASLAIGIVAGTLIAIVRMFRVPVLAKFLAVIVTVYNGVPIVIAMIIYNLLFMLRFDSVSAALGLSLRIRDVPAVWIGVFTLSLSAICGLSECIRGALMSVDKGQFEGGYSCGMKTGQVMTRIVLPQAYPIALPVMLNHMIGLLKGTSVVMAVGIMDVLNGALLPCQMTYSFLVGYIAAAVIYWTLTLIIERLAKIAQKRADKMTRRAAAH
jgi:L-cystine transport system permease protein